MKKLFLSLVVLTGVVFAVYAEEVIAEFVVTGCGTVRQIPVNSSPSDIEFYYQHWTRKDCPDMKID